MSTPGTDFALEAVLGDFELDRGQVQDLAFVFVLGHDGVQTSPAPGTGGGRMGNNVVGMLGKGEGVSGMSLLCALFASGGLALGGGFLVEGVTCGGLAAVVAVFAALVFELLEACGEGLVGVLQGRDEGKNGVGNRSV